MSTEKLSPEQRIAQFFNDQSTSMKKRDETDGIPDSAKQQIQDIIKTDPTSVLDVGSGSGGILVELLSQGIPRVTGVDLSPAMIEVTRQRLESKGYTGQTKIIRGNFLDLDLEPTDAVSLHRVLCCHPDRHGMLNKTTFLSPRTISLTVPRDWKILRILLFPIGLILQLLGKFRPFIHPQKVIDTQLTKQGYRIVNRKKGFWWVTTTYENEK